ncbi:hypothetical protein [Burkholderia cenocepacia]|uniref:hypothetical protein n=1 Tax=Burkholderia cenocepacia TaxID=95486 RepID=UPI00285CC671|nr:hypothetical protein [Burkholderia cenocepacia]MDR8054211.1 hypothetical protein [Burkholderia cenocepacia]MDR8064654.1 hypothetical protein [Burkholderia cenocepacia]
MANQVDDIVDIVISVNNAPIPNNLQRKSILVSQGGTTLPAGTTQLVASPKDITGILQAPVLISSIQWSAGVATVTVTGTIPLAAGATAQYTIAGVSPAAYNGTFSVTGVTSSSFTFSLGNNPGTTQKLGTATPAAVAEVQSMGNSFFAGGTAISTTILELGLASGPDAVAAITAYLQNNALQNYVYVVPRSWATSQDFLTLVAQYDNPMAMTYFAVTATRSNLSSVGPAFASHKCVELYAESDADLATGAVFGAAAMVYLIVSQNPTSTQKLLPIAPRVINGVQPGKWTPTERTLLQQYSFNYPDAGIEAGLTNTLLKGNAYASGDFFEYWYASDATAIRVHLALTNAIVNGNENAINPIKFDQRGIERLQQVAQSTIDALVAAGVLLPANQVTGTGIVNAVDFLTYTNQNPSDYRTGVYRGLSVTVIPSRGFTHVTFNMAVTDLVNNAT